MIEKEIVLKGSDAELLNRALAEVKTRIFNESEHRASDTEAIEALVYCFRKSENGPMDYLYHYVANRAWVRDGFVKEDDVYPLSLY
ncbi:MAG: hypothetical protein WCG09_07830 [Halobacteriota archaeon]|jgi:hypothetical protein